VAFDAKWLHAQLNLAWHVVLHGLRRLWPWSPRYGLRRFQENYVLEGLAPTTPHDRATLAMSAGRCTACGLCDDACPILRGARPDVAAADFMGPQAFVLAGARATPQLEDLGGTLDVLADDGCQGCRACDRACPEVIPITALAVALSAQRQVVRDAQQGRFSLRPGALPAPEGVTTKEKVG
jgi:succinate dehydrogenase/fumarate reductase-like Fe-S protein